MFQTSLGHLVRLHLKRKTKQMGTNNRARKNEKGSVLGGRRPHPKAPPIKILNFFFFFVNVDIFSICMNYDF